MQGYRMYIGGDLMNKTDEWICQCGRINSGKFCSKCGREKTVFVKKQVIAAPNNGTSNNNIIKVLGIVAVVAVAAYGSYALVESNSPSYSDVPQKVENTGRASAVVNDVPDKVDQQNVSSELSLGGLIIGDTEDKMRSVKGKPTKSKLDGSMIRYYYPDMEVVIENRVVTALVSNGPDLKTKRGFHEGSTLDEIVKSYGDSSMKFEADGLVMYEYTFQTDILGEGILRYAISKSDNRVNYISVRLNR